MKRAKTTIYVTAYLLLVLAVWIFFILLPQPGVVTLNGQAGVVDLSGVDFEDTVYRYPYSHWQYYPEALLTPQDFAGPDAPQPESIGQEDIRTVQYATHRMQLRLPPGQVYALSMRSADYAMRLFIDGTQAGAVGSPGDTAKSNTPGVAEVTYYFQPTGDVTTILVQSSNWVHREGAYAPNFTVGTAANIDGVNRHTLLTTILITGCLLTAFLYHLGLFVLNRRRVVTVVFALGCLLLAAMSSNLYALFPTGLSWYTAFRVEYIIHFATFAVLVVFLRLLFARLLHRTIVYSYCGLAGLYILTTFVFPPKVYSTLIVGFEIASACMIAYVLVRLAMQLKERKLQNTLAFVGLLPVCLLGLNDLLYKSFIVSLGSVAGQIFSAPIGMVFFVFCYALVVALEYAETERAMMEARENEARLTADNLALDRINRTKNDLMLKLTHELRTPLTVVSGYAQYTLQSVKEGDITEQTTEDLELINSEARRLADMAADVLQAFSAKETVVGMAPFLIETVLRQVGRLATPLVDKNSNTLTLDIEKNLPYVYGRAEECTQLLWNLIANAARHTKNGKVMVRASMAKDGEGQPVLAVAVTDTGEGVPPESLPFVFERQYTSSEGGAGLGLYICKEIVEAHGGTIGMTSTCGKGSEVTFVLPLTKEEERP